MTGWEASLMGFTIVAGGQLYGWNTGQSIFLVYSLWNPSSYKPSLKLTIPLQPPFVQDSLLDLDRISLPNSWLGLLM